MPAHTEATELDDGERRTVPLAIPAGQFRSIGYEMVDTIAGFLDTLARRPVAGRASPDALRAVLQHDQPLPATGSDPAELLRSAGELLFDHSLFNGHPRFFGYITSSPAPIGMFGDLLAAAVNANVGAWRLGPIATEIEAQAVRWLAELIGYPLDCGGLFVSGGNMANIVGMYAARAAAAEWDVRSSGIKAPTSRRLRIYASAETHTWIQKAADMSGVGTDAIRWIRTDAQQRMDPRSLQAALDRDRQAGDLPMMVVGTAGTVSTGAVDPLFEIARICSDAGVWFHVDGAYGALAACAPGTPADLQAMRQADSVAVDPHKWLYTPLEAGCILVRDPAVLRNAFAYHPPYFHFGQGAINYSELGPQTSRGFRALKVWLALRHAGRAGYVQMISDDIALSRRLAASIVAHPEFEAHSQELSITTFRYVPADLRNDTDDAGTGEYLNALNQALLEKIQLSGDAFVSNTFINGKYLLRACIVNFNTARADVDALPDIIVRLGREVDAGLRSPAAGSGRVGEWRTSEPLTAAG